MDAIPTDFSALSALYINTTLTRSPDTSHTQRLIDVSADIMRKQGVKVDGFRSVDHPIAPGVYPDMREYGWEQDAWPDLFPRVKAADIVVIAGPIWLGDNSSETKKVIERLYAHSGENNERGQAGFYGKAGGCIITGNEDGIKHCAANVLFSLQHIGFTVPPEADAGWIGDVGPGPSYGDELDDGTRAGFDNDFTNRSITFTTWNLIHLAAMLKAAGGFPAHGNQPEEWQAGTRFDFANPEYRA